MARHLKKSGKWSVMRIRMSYFTDPENVQKDQVPDPDLEPRINYVKKILQHFFLTFCSKLHNISWELNKSKQIKLIQMHLYFGTFFSVFSSCASTGTYFNRFFTSWIWICISPYGSGSNCYYPNSDTRIRIPITEFDTDSVPEHIPYIKNFKKILNIYYFCTFLKNER